jgi:hypothetical protein
LNSEAFRETFLRNDREGPTKAEMAGKKEAKQKAGPRGQTEKNREETGSFTGAKSTSEEVGQRTAQNTQRKEAHRDLKGQGESKKPSMTKRRQARKVATMVKQLKKNPEDGESQPPTEVGADLASGDGWDAQQQATVTAYTQSRGMQPREVLQALVNSMEKTLRKEKGGNPASQIPPLSVKQRGEVAGKAKAGLTPEEREGIREKKKRIATASRSAEIREEGYLRKPGGKKSKRKRPEAWSRQARRTRPWRYQGRKELLLQWGRKEAKPSKPRKRPKRA